MSLQNYVLSDEVYRIIEEIAKNRDRIKDDFIKAWIALKLPDHLSKDEAVEHILNSYAIQEKWSDDRMSVTWQLVERFEVKK